MTWLGKPINNDPDPNTAPAGFAVPNPLLFPGPENIEFIEPLTAEERARQDLKVEVIAASLPRRWNAKRAAQVLYVYRRLRVKQPPSANHLRQVRRGFADVLSVKDQVAFVELCLKEFGELPDRLRVLLVTALK